MTRTIESDQVRLIAALRYDPGFILLGDFLQAKLDNITDELAAVSDDRDLAKLHYWRAFRDFVRTLKTQPESFASQLTPEERGADENPTIDGNSWVQLRKYAQEYLQSQIAE